MYVFYVPTRLASFYVYVSLTIQVTKSMTHHVAAARGMRANRACGGPGGRGGGSPVLGLAAARAARRPAARLLLAARERAHHLHTARPGQRRRRRPDRQLSSQSCRSGLNAALRNGMTRLDVIVPGRSRNKQSLAVLTGDPTGNTR